MYNLIHFLYKTCEFYVSDVSSDCARSLALLLCFSPSPFLSLFFFGGGGCCCFLSLMCLVFFSVCVSLMLSISPSPFLYITLSIYPSTLSPYSLSFFVIRRFPTYLPKMNLMRSHRNWSLSWRKSFPDDLQPMTTCMTTSYPEHARTSILFSASLQ